MEIEELKSAVEKAQEAVKGISDESLRKIAFQKVLDTLLASPVVQQHPQVPNIQTSISNARTSTQSTGTIQESISEFINSKNQKSHFNLVLAMAFYIHFKVGEDFGIEDIRKGYKSCLIPEPKNITDIINQNIRKALIVKSDKQKDGKLSYHIAKQGIDYVNSDFKMKLKFSQPKPRTESKENVPSRA